MKPMRLFQHTAARRRLAATGGRYQQSEKGFNTQPPEGGWGHWWRLLALSAGFNTQPPEGGWNSAAASSTRHGCFNTQPPEGGWLSREWPDCNTI